jgi:hypothetical protein
MTVPTTLEEALELRAMLKHKDAIYETLQAHLETFLPGDLGEASVGIRVPNCHLPEVSEEAFEVVFAELEELRGEVLGQLAELNTMRVKFKEEEQDV